MIFKEKFVFSLLSFGKNENIKFIAKNDITHITSLKISKTFQLTVYLHLLPFYFKH